MSADMNPGSVAKVAKERPVNLDLTKFAFPLPALTSITHRITGVVLFAGVAFLLYLLDLALHSGASWREAQALMDGGFAKFVTWAVLASLAYHLVAGVKHLVMDWGVGETLEGARSGAWFTIIASAVLFILAGVWVW